jgi:hypothetical protein
VPLDLAEAGRVAREPECTRLRHLAAAVSSEPLAGAQADPTLMR